MQLWRRATRSTSLGSVSCRRISCTILNATGATMPGSSGRRASAIRIRNSRERRRALISVAVFLRGNSPKYSSMYWISSAPVSSGYCLIRYSIKIRSIVPQVGAQPALHLLDANTLSCRVVFDLVSADAADGEVPGLGVCEIEAAHRRGRGHGRAFGQ